MSFEKVKRFFDERGLGDRVTVLSASSATVALAAEAIGCEPKRIAKSLSFMTGDGAILLVAAGDARIDNRKYKERFSQKATMLTPEQAEGLIGHAVGGVCPFAINDGVRVFLDVSLKRFDTVFPAAGSSDSVIELSLSELELYSAFSNWVDVCKGWE